MTPKIGCSTLVFGGQPLELALRSIALAGYDGIELTAIAGMAEHVPLRPDRSLARAVREQVADCGLEIFHLGIHSAISEPAGSQRLLQGLELAQELEVPLVLNATADYPATEEGLDRACDTLGILAERARTLGIRLGIKPHVNMAVFDTRTAQAMLARVGAPNLGLDFDVSHIYRANEDPIEAFRALAEHVYTVRIRDAGSRDKTVGPAQGQVPGRGVIDLPGFLRTLRELDYAGDASVDIVGTNDLPLEQVVAIAAETRGYIRGAMQALGWS